MASKLVSAVVAGTAGGLLIGCTFPVMVILVDALISVLSRPEEVSPTVTPASDQNMWIALMLFMLLVFVLVPVFLAVTGALAVRLSRSQIPDVKSCILFSYAAGILAIVIGIVLYIFTSSLVAGPSFEDVPLDSRISNSIAPVIGWFTNPSAIVIMLLAALISPAGGAFYWLATKHAAAQNR